MEVVQLDIGEYTGEINEDRRPHGHGVLRYIINISSKLRSILSYYAINQITDKCNIVH